MKINPIAPNQTEIQTENKSILFSYKTPVAAFVDDNFYRTKKKWSVTTSKHINKWLDGRKAEEKEQEFFDGLVR